MASIRWTLVLCFWTAPSTLTEFFSIQLAGTEIERGHFYVTFPATSLTLIAAGLSLLLFQSFAAVVAGLKFHVLSTCCLETGFKGRKLQEIADSLSDNNQYPHQHPRKVRR